MRILKNTDEKIEALGFAKIEENKYGVEYERENKDYGYMQRVCIFKKASGNHILQSYDPARSDKDDIGCICVGLTYTELKLFAKKMREMGLKS